jgi:hypothetical protein
LIAEVSPLQSSDSIVQTEGGFDLLQFTQSIKAECHHLGFIPREGIMPATIDIRMLATAFPESVAMGPTINA